MIEIKNMASRPVSLYIHIPFCVSKCNYCDFLSFPGTSDQKKDYLKALQREIAASPWKGRRVKSVFIGGGTPSLMSGIEADALMKCIRDSFELDGKNNGFKDAEITIECNPASLFLHDGSISEEEKTRLSSYHKSGINRISIGLQSAEDSELKLLGRAHSSRDFAETYHRAAEAGFENINVDIMSAIPGQTMDSYKRTLETVFRLNPRPAHISAYSLILEEGTGFYRNKSVIDMLPDEDTEREMYYLTNRLLGEEGYHRYEISNYAMTGMECVHNKVYWQGGDYLGFGIGAASLMNGIRFSNICNIHKYVELMNNNTELIRKMSDACENITADNTENKAETYRTDVQILTIEEQMEEYMFLGLRMMEGISIGRWKERFSVDIDTVYGNVLKELVEKKLLIRHGDTIKLSESGIDISNRIFAEFLL